MATGHHGVGSVADEEAEEEGVDDFLNFSYNNLPSLLQRNLELMRSNEKGQSESLPTIS